uniref:K-box domain-containing protein n=1 Tax=Quercus lobata TaxID=97700 RepID=A0A7N2L9H3_QUELO
MCCKCAEIANKPSIEGSKAMETSHLMYNRSSTIHKHPPRTILLRIQESKYRTMANTIPDGCSQYKINGMLNFSHRRQVESLSKILDRYQSRFQVEMKESKGLNDIEKNHLEDASLEDVSLPSHAELLEIVQSQLEGPNIEQLSVTDLVKLERQFNAALSQTRSRKTQLMLESIMSLHEKERMLREEKKLLQRKIRATQDTKDRTEVVLGLIKHSNNQLAHPPQLETLSLLP